jgi:flagellar biosynthetic protein FlhB
LADSNKTEKPTPRRRQKAREKGQIARSRELISSLSAIAAVLTLAAQGPVFAARWRALLRRTLDAASLSPTLASVPLLNWEGMAVLQGAGLALVLCWMTSVVAAVAQGGLVFAPAALQPNLSRLSPSARLQQLFSLPAVGRMLKSLLPVAAMGYFVIALLARDWRPLLSLVRHNVRGLAVFGMDRVFAIAWQAALVLVIWSVVDYFLEKQKLEGDLRMSRQELLDEYKETEGHPTVKGRIRRLQRQMRRRRMLDEVRRAAVVITNPTEFAIALEYGPLLAAPTVLAKGRNLVARQIKEIARWHGIPLVENPPLAHALYRAVEVGQAIPPKLYAAVAGILAAIYRAQERATRTAAPGGGLRHG